MKARELHLAGGQMNVEIVDAKEKIDELMLVVDAMVKDSLVTLERLEVIKYRAGG